MSQVFYKYISMNYRLECDTMGKNLILGSVILGLMLLFSGCCGSTGSGYSSSCTTYGEACTSTCEAAKGTQFDGGENCFSDCTSNVRAQGFGDATTCCKETIRASCQRTCDNSYSSMVSKYGDAVDDTREEYVGPCFDECTGPYVQMGISIESCSVIDPSAFLE